MFLDSLAQVGEIVAATPFTLGFFFDEEECPKSLIK